MIICGYQGIGKSSLVRSYNYLHSNLYHAIDLESGNFWVDGKRCDDWYRIYANIAIHLSKQGNIVFTSSHKIVRDYLASINTTETLAVCYPDISLKDEWINKLQRRYDSTGLEKDYKALMNAKEMFDNNIEDLSSQEGFEKIAIMSINYDLNFVIRHFIEVINNHTEYSKLETIRTIDSMIKFKD